MKERVKNNKGIGLVVLLMLIIFLLLIVCGAVYYFMVYSDTEQIYKRLIDSSMNAYQDSIDQEEYKTISAKIGANVNVELKENNEQTDKIVNLINSLDVALNVQMDREDKKMLMKLESNYKKDELLNSEIFADVQKEKMYINVENVFDKFVEMDMDNETSTSLSEMFEATYTNKDDLKKAIDIFKEELKNVIKPEYCSSQKEEITVNDKKINATKNTVSMTSEQLADEIITVFTNLKDNQEFLNCYENSDDMVDIFEELIEQLEDSKSSTNDVDFKFSLYTTGLKHKVAKIDVEAIDDDEIIKVEIVKIDENNFEILGSYEEENIKANIIKANVKKVDENESECVLEINVPDTAKVILNLSIACKLNEQMEQFDASNTMKMEDMTQEDTNKIMERFSNTKLYELIDEFSGGMLNKKGIFEKPIDTDNSLEEVEEKEI